MANAYSIIHNYDQPLYSPDFNYIQAALNARQGKYDANKSKLNSLYSQLEALQVAKGVDQKHIEDRLQRIYDNTDRYGVMDLSDDNLMTGIFANLGQVFDDKTKNAIVSTKRIQYEDSKWKWMEENEPEKYAQLNHRFALSKSDREAYMASENAGDIYRGGADFIEYRDLGKKFFELAPKMQQILKAKYVETGENQGYFRNLITHEVVSADKVSEVYDMLLDDKDKMQLNINAWGTYDKVSNEDLKREWNAQLEPTLSKINNTISALEVEMEKPENANLKKEYNLKLKELREQRKSTENNYFDKVYNKIGREGLYTALYNKQFKDKIVYTYSKDEIVDVKLDQAHAEGIKFKQKLAEFDWQQKKDLANLELAKNKDKREQEKHDREYGKENTGYKDVNNDVNQSNLGTSFLGQEIKDKRIENLTDDFNLDINKSVKDVQEVFKKEFGRWLTTDELRKSLLQLQPGNVSSNEIKTITINGKSVKIDMNKYYDKFLNAYNNVLNDNPVRKELYNKSKEILGNVIFTQMNLQWNSKGNRAAVPNFKTWIVKGSDGQLEIKQRNNLDVNYYSVLLEKNRKYKNGVKGAKPLTDLERKNLYYYAGETLKADNSFDVEDRNLIHNYMKFDLLSDVNDKGLLMSPSMLDKGRIEYNTGISKENNEDYKRLKRRYDIENGLIVLNKGETYKKLDDSELKRLNRYIFEQKAAEDYSRLINTKGGYKRLGDMGGLSEGSFNFKQSSSFILNAKTNIQQKFDDMRSSLDKHISDIKSVPDVTSILMDKGTPEYQKAVSFFGLTGDKAKNANIVISRTVDSNGNVNLDSEDVHFTYIYEKNGEQKTREVTVSTQDWKDMGFTPYEKIKPTIYDAELKGNAGKIPMGTNYIEGDFDEKENKLNYYRNINNGSLSSDQLKVVLNEYPKEVIDFSKKYFNDYNAGKYLFKVELVDGVYRNVIYKNSKDSKSPVFIDYNNDYGSRIKESDVKNITKDTFIKNDDLFSAFVVSRIETLYSE